MVGRKVPFSSLIIVLTLVALVACSQASSTATPAPSPTAPPTQAPPTAVAVVPTAPPASTPTPLAPTSTVTAVPPTATAALPPPSPTATENPRVAALLGTYSITVTADELAVAGVAEQDRCEDSGVISLDIAAAFYTFRQVAADGCQVGRPRWGGTWKIAGDTIVFTDTNPYGCPDTYTYGYQLGGDTLTFTKVADSCTNRALVMALHPWQRQR